VKKVTLIIPAYNEAESLTGNLETILAQVSELDEVALELLVVNDGSDDRTLELMQVFCETHPQVSLLSLNRHFGKEAAILAGLDHAGGDAAVVMDSDLQHPPELIPQMVRLWLGGVEVVEAYKSARPAQSALYRLLARGFYAAFATLTGMDLRNQSDFKLLDRKVIDAYRRMPERTRFFRGLVKWLHFTTAQLPFEEPQRQGGHSKWNGSRLLRLSWQSISSFTALPLQLVTLLGLFTFVISLALGGKALYDKLSGHALDGFTTVILLLLIIGSVLMFSLGLMGSYIARIYDEIKARPIYLVDDKNSRLKEPS
jgi:glycosyltransferase involved in cell wall biosynthesis